MNIHKALATVSAIRGGFNLSIFLTCQSCFILITSTMIVCLENELQLNTVEILVNIKFQRIWQFQKTIIKRLQESRGICVCKGQDHKPIVNDFWALRQHCNKKQTQLCSGSLCMGSANESSTNEKKNINKIQKHCCLLWKWKT